MITTDFITIEEVIEEDSTNFRSFLKEHIHDEFDMLSLTDCVVAQYVQDMTGKDVRAYIDGILYLGVTYTFEPDHYLSRIQRELLDVSTYFPTGKHILRILNSIEGM